MKAQLVTVKFVKAHPSFSYFAGNVGHVTPEKAAMLLKKGYAMPVPEEEDDSDNPLPEDLPARDVLYEAGYDSIDKIAKAGDQITDVKGIGKSTLGAIKEYMGNPAK